MFRTPSIQTSFPLYIEPNPWGKRAEQKARFFFLQLHMCYQDGFAYPKKLDSTEQGGIKWNGIFLRIGQEWKMPPIKKAFATSVKLSLIPSLLTLKNRLPYLACFKSLLSYIFAIGTPPYPFFLVWKIWLLLLVTAFQRSTNQNRII